MTTVLKLYEASDALRIVEAWIDEHLDDIAANGGALPDELEALLRDAEGAFDAKAERVALKVREMEATAKVVKEEAQRLASRAKAMEASAASLKAYLVRQMQEAHRDAAKGTLVTVRLQHSAPRVRTLLPDEALLALPALAPYIREEHIPARVERTLDTKALLAALQGGTLTLGDEVARVERTPFVRFY